MQWLIDIFTEQTFIQAVLVLSLISATGLLLGNLKFFGISLGITFVFFAGILAGHFGLDINPDMLSLAQNFGLILFVYALGVQVGPGFFPSFKRGGFKLNTLSTLLLILGAACAIVTPLLTNITFENAVGLLCGAATNTPMLGAAQQSVLQVNPEGTDTVNSMAMATAVGYPFGVIGVILAIATLCKLYGKNQKIQTEQHNIKTYITEYHISNPAIYGKTIKEIMSKVNKHLVISRVWKDGKVLIPGPDTILDQDDHILVMSEEKDVEAIKTIFGIKENVDWNKQDIDWDHIDSQLVSKKILITKNDLNGVKLGALKLRNLYGINVTRVNRAGIDLLPSSGLRLQFGDKLTIVGESNAIDNAGIILGNEQKRLSTPNLFTVFIGISLGLILGSIPVPGMSIPVKLGIAGGPIIVGILMGAFGPRFHLTTYATRSANLMMRQLGIVTYLAGLGLSAGKGFFETVFQPEGALWVLISFFMAYVPTLLVGILSVKIFKIDYERTAGMLCASMANPIALNYANSTVQGDEPAVAYATVYPLSIFLRVITIQFIMLSLGEFL